MRTRLLTGWVLLVAVALGGCAVYPSGYYGSYGYYPSGYAPAGYYEREPGSYEYRYHPYYSSDYNSGYDTYRTIGGGNG